MWNAPLAYTVPSGPSISTNKPKKRKSKNQRFKKWKIVYTRIGAYGHRWWTRRRKKRRREVGTTRREEGRWGGAWAPFAFGGPVSLPEPFLRFWVFGSWRFLMNLGFWNLIQIWVCEGKKRGRLICKVRKNEKLNVESGIWTHALSDQNLNLAP